jgi:hypothetical protein
MKSILDERLYKEIKHALGWKKKRDLTNPDDVKSHIGNEKYSDILEYYDGSFPPYIGPAKDAHEFLVESIRDKRHLALICCHVATPNGDDWFYMEFSDYVNCLTYSDKPCIEFAYIPNQ